MNRTSKLGKKNSEQFAEDDLEAGRSEGMRSPVRRGTSTPNTNGKLRQDVAEQDEQQRQTELEGEENENGVKEDKADQKEEEEEEEDEDDEEDDE